MEKITSDVNQVAKNSSTVSPNQSVPVIEISGLTKYYPIPRSVRDVFSRKHPMVRGVDGIDLVIGRGETLGLIGESGSGKSTLGRSMVRLVEPTAGSIKFNGQDVIGLGQEELRKMRRRIAVVFQNPFAAVNRRKRVSTIVSEPLQVHNIGTKSERLERVKQVLKLAGLGEGYLERFPSELSGGQLQRVAIARALVLSPELIIADEPTASLDVSVRAQVINLFADLREQLGLSMLFISHDLATVSYLTDRIAVMYLGRIVESGTTDSIVRNPRHPYTRTLIASIPSLFSRPQLEIAKVTEKPTLSTDASMCPYFPRCPMAMTVCETERPLLKDSGDSHLVACHAINP